MLDDNPSLRVDYVKTTLRDPVAAINYAFKGKLHVKCLCLKRLTGASVHRISQIYSDLANHNDFMRRVSDALSLAGNRFYGQLYGASEMYVLCRLLQPRIVLETGVSAGVSSAFILRALEDNTGGTLYSVDMPNHEHVLVGSDKHYPLQPVSMIPPGLDPGWSIPSELRSRWKLSIGLSREILPTLVKNVSPIDIFLHDSEHTYSNMLFEYVTVWPNIAEGGLLMSDNTNWNAAFPDFARSISMKPVAIYFSNLKGLRRPSLLEART